MTKIEMEDPVDKMRLIRNKMVEAENEKAREANAKMKVMKATWGYEEQTRERGPPSVLAEILWLK